MSAGKTATARKSRNKIGYRIGHHYPEFCRVKFRKEQWKLLSSSAGFSEHSRAKAQLRSACSRYMTTRLALPHYPYAREVAASLEKSKRYVDSIAARLGELKGDQAFEQSKLPNGNLFGLDVDVGFYSVDTVDRVALTELGHYARDAYKSTRAALTALEMAEASYRELSKQAFERARFLGKELKPPGGRISRDETYEPEVLLLTVLAQEMQKRGLSLKLGSTSSTNQKWLTYPYPKAATALLHIASVKLPNRSQGRESEIAPSHWANYLTKASPVTFLRLLEIVRSRISMPS